MCPQRLIHARAVHPPFIFGPSGRGQVLSSSAPVTGTNSHVYALLNGPAGRPVPATAVVAEFIDVRDAARAHVLALSAPLTPGKAKKALTSGGAFTWVQAVRHLREKKPELRARLPALEGVDLPAEGTHARYDVGSAERVLGLKEYVPFEKTVEAVVEEALQRESVLGTIPAAA